MAALAFPAFNLGFLACVAFVPLCAAFEEPWARARPDDPAPRGGAAARLGFWFGFGFFLPLLYWLPLLPAENVTVPGLMYPALLLGVAYLSLYTAGAGWLLAFLRRRGGVPLVLAAPSAWVLLEVVRASGPLGFPWGSIGYSQWSLLPLLQMASLGGLWLVSFWVVLVNAVGFEAIRSGRTARRRVGAAVGREVVEVEAPGEVVDRPAHAAVGAIAADRGDGDRGGPDLPKMIGGRAARIVGEDVARPVHRGAPELPGLGLVMAAAEHGQAVAEVGECGRGEHGGEADRQQREHHRGAALRGPPSAARKRG